MRSLVTALSIGAIAGYGCALAGLGGFLLGRGNMDYIVWGLLGGTVSGAAALYLFHEHPEAFYEDFE